VPIDLPPFLPRCARLERYEAGEGSIELVLRWTTGPSIALERVEVREGKRSLVVGVVERVPTGPMTLEGMAARVAIRLTRPLGGRAVIDASSGRRLAGAA
jgi:hypothetical protein